MYAEALRVAAMLAVVVVHVAAKSWYRTGVETLDWKVLNVYDSLFRWCVPVFVMLSGMFMLDPARRLSLRSLYGRNILRMATAFVFWSAIYIAYDAVSGTQVIAFDPATRAALAHKFFFGRYHLWFLFLITGLYVVTPVMQVMAANRRATEYFLVLAVVFGALLPSLSQVPGTAEFVRWMGKFSIQLPLGYAGYYLAGYYLRVREIGVRARRGIYALGMLGFLCTAVFTDLLSVQAGKPSGVLYGYLMPNVLLSSVAVFVFFKYEIGRIPWRDRSRRWLCRLSAQVFGIYLVHDLFNQWFWKIGFCGTSFHPVLAVPVVSAAVFAGSLLAVLLLGRIPGLKNHVM